MAHPYTILGKFILLSRSINDVEHAFQTFKSLTSKFIVHCSLQNGCFQWKLLPTKCLTIIFIVSLYSIDDLVEQDSIVKYCNQHYSKL